MLWLWDIFEIEFVDRDTPQPTRGAAARLRRLGEIAEKLEGSGWRIWFTITGLAFQPPEGSLPDDMECDERYRWAEDRLAQLGIQEPFSHQASRTAAELEKAGGRLWNRLWYERKLDLIHEPGYDPAAEFANRPDIVQGMLQKMAQCEQEGLEEEFPVGSEFEYGTILDVRDGEVAA